MSRTAAGRFFFKHNHYPQRSQRTETDKERNDSIWSVIYCTAKNLGVSPDYVLNDLSYINMLMYGYATPEYDYNKKDEKDWDDRLDANNPDNFKNKNTEEEYIR